jgi:hypothetical protein
VPHRETFDGSRCRSDDAITKCTSEEGELDHGRVSSAERVDGDVGALQPLEQRHALNCISRYGRDNGRWYRDRCPRMLRTCSSRSAVSAP